MQARIRPERRKRLRPTLQQIGRAIRGLILVVHPFPVLVVLITSALVMVIARGGVLPAGLALRALLAVLLTQIPVGALNDIVDREDDARMQPDKPIPSGLLSAKAAGLLAGGSLAGLGAVLASFGPLAPALVIPATLGGLAYDFWLKPTPFAVVGYAAGFLLLFTWLWLVAGHFTSLLVALWPAGVLLLLAAHLSQSLPDIETDRALGHRGLAAALGPKRTLQLIGATYAAASATAIVLGALSRQPAALALALAGALLGLAAAVMARNGWLTRARRVRFFHVAAPGIGLTALALLLAVARQ